MRGGEAPDAQGADSGIPEAIVWEVTARSAVQYYGARELARALRVSRAWRRLHVAAVLQEPLGAEDQRTLRGAADAADRGFGTP